MFGAVIGVDARENKVNHVLFEIVEVVCLGRIMRMPPYL